MKKIIAVFDGLKFSESVKEYAIHISKLYAAHLVGVFLDDMTYTGYKIYELLSQEGVSEALLKKYDEIDKTKRKHAASAFETACKKAGTEFNIHHDKKIAIHELLHESIYSDLMIIDRKETLTHYDEKQPSRFIRNLLADVQCPVLLVPQKFLPFKKIIFLYNGEPSSVYAIKMFGYIFAELKNMEVQVVSVKNPNDTLHLPDNTLMKEFVKRHYPDALYEVLRGLPEVEIAEYLKEQPASALVVLGAYRRSAASRLFRQSMADVLMNNINLPLFIAHNK
ncbi:MAG TPA: hypothetical protein VMT76_02290 [Puia sp.]|nr:hypothetical protein [Puia sp.]